MNTILLSLIWSLTGNLVTQAVQKIVGASEPHTYGPHATNVLDLIEGFELAGYDTAQAQELTRCTLAAGMRQAGVWTI